MEKGLENFEPIFGKANVEWDDGSSDRCCLFHVDALDAHRIRIHATDYHSYTWESILSIQQLEDLRDYIGIGGSWSEFLDYLISSLKSDNVKLLMHSGKSKDSTSDHGATVAKLIAHKSKGMPLISVSLDRLMNSLANDAMANLSLELFRVFKGKEHCYQLGENVSAQQGENGSIQNQLDEVPLFSKQHKLRKLDTDKALPLANSSSSLDTVTIPNTHESPEKQSTQVPPSRKVGHRVAPAYRRAKVRGVVLEDTDNGEST